MIKKEIVFHISPRGILYQDTKKDIYNKIKMSQMTELINYLEFCRNLSKRRLFGGW